MWSVVPSANPGTTDNHLYGVKAVGPEDVWAMGQQVGASGPDQALIEHWDGRQWSVVPSAGHGTASAMLFSITTGDGGVWAVGQTAWSTAPIPVAARAATCWRASRRSATPFGRSVSTTPAATGLTLAQRHQEP